MMWSGFESKEEEYVWEVEIVQHDEDENDKDEQKNDEDDEKKKEDYEDEENVQDDVEMHGTERRVFMIRRSRWMIVVSDDGEEVEEEEEKEMEEDDGLYIFSFTESVYFNNYYSKR